MSTHYYGFRDRTGTVQVLKWAEEGPTDLSLEAPPDWEGYLVPYWGPDARKCEPLAYSLLLDAWGQQAVPRALYSLFAARYLVHVAPESELLLDSEDILRMVVVLLHGMVVVGTALPATDRNGKGGQ